MNCFCLNCEIQGIEIEAVSLYKDEYGSKIPLCADCLAAVQEESYAPGADMKDE